jgi:hypothetical protein
MSPRPVSKQVSDLVHARLAVGLSHHTGGFASEQAKLISLGKVELSGVELDGEDDTKPLRGAQAKVECLLTVDECEHRFLPSLSNLRQHPCPPSSN